MRKTEIKIKAFSLVQAVSVLSLILSEYFV